MLIEDVEPADNTQVPDFAHDPTRGVLAQRDVEAEEPQSKYSTLWDFSGLHVTSGLPMVSVLLLPILLFPRTVIPIPLFCFLFRGAYWVARAIRHRGLRSRRVSSSSRRGGRTVRARRRVHV